MYVLQRSEYEDVCLNEECMVKIVKVENGSTGSNEALSKSTHTPSSSVNITYDFPQEVLFLFLTPIFPYNF